jgi:predicted transcriptional regulator
VGTVELLNFFKALSDANRLKIVGLLAQAEYTGEQLAAMLELRASTVSHHLSQLIQAGLVTARAEGYYSVYKLDQSALEAMAKRLLSREDLPAIVSDIDLDAYDRKVLKDFSLPDGRLKTIPSQQKKLIVILRHLASSFDKGERYPEQKVNEILLRFHADTASLRRALVDHKFMERDGGIYWRVGSRRGDPADRPVDRASAVN